ncbi:hypothetical protein ACFVXE_19360 [Streptomyces sp. NPDC058231]|uniref:hypothetical protein n=1 Tax=Streptomyces sp. NPDC058231 TaxID=3346392 RepID=UPI0036ECA4C4
MTHLTADSMAELFSGAITLAKSGERVSPRGMATVSHRGGAGEPVDHGAAEASGVAVQVGGTHARGPRVAVVDGPRNAVPAGG